MTFIELLVKISLIYLLDCYLYSLIQLHFKIQL